jgi:hypothetical protein
MTISGYQGVKVFSATKAKEREALGDQVTNWLRNHSNMRIVEKLVRQSSDCGFHCLSIIVFWAEP